MKLWMIIYSVYITLLPEPLFLGEGRLVPTYQNQPSLAIYSLPQAHAFIGNLFEGY